jgi:hypothetical protein
LILALFEERPLATCARAISTSRLGAFTVTSTSVASA